MYRDVKIGNRYAYRVGKTRGTPAIQVEVLQFGPETSKHKVRVRYLGGEYFGLDEWVPKARLVVPWESHETWWEEELNQVEAVRFGEPEGIEEYMAVLHVFAAYRDESVFNVAHRRQEWGLLEIHDEDGALEALEGSGILLGSLPGFYRNRRGEPRASWPASVQIAKYLCKAFSRQIADAIVRELRVYERDTVHGRDLGRMYIEPEACKLALERERPICNLVLSWCEAGDVERLNRERALEDEVNRLRDLLADIVQDYRLSGHPQLASRLEKKIRLSTFPDLSD